MPVSVITIAEQGPAGPASVTVGAVITTEGDLLVGGAGGTPTAATPRRFHVSAYGAAGDGTTDDRTPILAAIAAAVAADGGTVEYSGDVGFTGEIAIPNGVALYASGHGRTAGKQASRLVCLDVPAQVRFLNGYGGISGNFIIDGNNIAPNPLQIDVVAGRVFSSIYVVNAASGGAAVKLRGTQNSLIQNLKIENCAGDGLVFDAGAASNEFTGLGIANCAGWNVRFRATELLSGLVKYPFNNRIDGFMIEGFNDTTLGLVSHGNGHRNYFGNGTFALGSVTSARSIVSMDIEDAGELANELILDNIYWFGATAYTTGITLREGVDITILGTHAAGHLKYFLDASDGCVVRNYGFINDAAIGGTLFNSPTATAFAENTIHRSRWKTVQEIDRATGSASAIVVSENGTPNFTVSPTGVMTWNGDTQLFRLAANILQTPDYLIVGTGAWNGTHLLVGGNNHWVDASGRLRIKAGFPLSDTDGRIVGTQNSGVGADVGNAAKTLTAGTDAEVQRWATPITANRAVTLSTTGAVNGDRFRIVRTAAATGAFTIDVGTGPLKSLAVSQWCDVTYDGSAWLLTAFGGL